CAIDRESQTSLLDLLGGVGARCDGRLRLSVPDSDPDRGVRNEPRGGGNDRERELLRVRDRRLGRRLAVRPIRSGAHAADHDPLVLVLFFSQRLRLEAAEDFFAIDSVNGVFVGLGDLGLSTGKRSSDSDVQRLVRGIADCARRFGKLSGIAAATPEEARSYLEVGYSLVMVSNDATIFAKAAAETLAATRSGKSAAASNRRS